MSHAGISRCDKGTARTSHCVSSSSSRTSEARSSSSQEASWQREVLDTTSMPLKVDADSARYQSAFHTIAMPWCNLQYSYRVTCMMIESLIVRYSGPVAAWPLVTQVSLRQDEVILYPIPASKVILIWWNPYHMAF